MVSLGCAKNRVDSENMLGMLRQRGYEIVGDPAEADVLFVNTCGFRTAWEYRGSGPVEYPL